MVYRDVPDSLRGSNLDLLLRRGSFGLILGHGVRDLDPFKCSGPKYCIITNVLYKYYHI